MRTWVLAFLLGDSSLLFFTSLPNIIWIWLLLLSILLGLILLPKKYLQRLRLAIACLLGCIWGILNASSTAFSQLPLELETKTLIATGKIITIPELHNKSISFEFQTEQLATNTYIYKTKLRIRLSWFHPEAQLKVGDNWQFAIRLKRPRSFWNLGNFDYEQWLFAHHIRATGYVVNNSSNHLLASSYFSFPIERLRTYLAKGVTTSLRDSKFVGLINALTVGVRNQITEDQWQVMRGTGTNHLFAIAGLHIGFISGMVYAVVSFIWRRAGKLPLYIPTPQVAALSALIIAIFYSALAGFALPTQRAVIMIAIFLLATLLRKQLPAWTAWSLALLLVLLMEPLSVLSDSFWLSFGAVAYIIYGISARVRQGHWWQQWGRTQWVVAVGLTPLTLLFFHQTSLAGFIANAFAIPWVGFVVLPLCLLGTFIWLLLPTLGDFLLMLSEQAMRMIWPILTYISSLEWAQWYTYISNFWILITAFIAMILLLAPRGFPARWLGLIWLLPLVYWQAIAPKSGEIWFTLLDVGQGLATVVRTQHHLLIYDTGPRFSETFDTGKAVIIPFLQHEGIKKVDMLVISHPDNDHIGGANSVLTQIPVTQVLTSKPEKFITANLCLAGQHWEWDGVNFTVLYPPSELHELDNDSSCVLRIDNSKQSILLVGDIEKYAERYLTSTMANYLASTILVVPHHGSKTSSSEAFIKAVKPKLALFAVGYRNRFGFPKMEIVQRYQLLGAKTLATVDEGAVNIKLSQEKMKLETYREKYHHFWNQ